MDSIKHNIKISTKKMNMENSIKLTMVLLISMLRDENLMDNFKGIKLMDLLKKYF